MISIIKGDLFTQSDKDSSLAHCVAKDLRLGAGIALLFKKKFGSVDKLRDQNPEVGSVVFLEREGRFIYNLVTKQYSSRCLPTLENLKKSLVAMKEHALKHEVKMISMPKIGSGLDKLDWDLVLNVIKEVFSDTNISLKIFYL
jgi:O-acetyl-ADP-ribose deacetylase (regulator of RNase III)